MLHTPVCDRLGITYPIVLGGMGSATSVPLVAAVSQAGGLGTLGAMGQSAAQISERIAEIRSATDKPFGVNYLSFRIEEDSFAAALAARPPVMAFAWARRDQDLRPYFQRAHDAGLLVMYMADEVPEAVRAAGAGADVIVAQGTEGGGHVGWMASMPLVPMIVSSVAPLPVLAAGALRMAEAWPQPWHWALMACCWARGSWPRMRRRSIPITSRRSCRAAVTIRC